MPLVSLTDSTLTTGRWRTHILFGSDNAGLGFGDSWLSSRRSARDPEYCLEESNAGRNKGIPLVMIRWSITGWEFTIT
jgi:hypothetical protein